MFQTFGYEPSDAARNFAKQKNYQNKIYRNLNEIENGSLDVITLLACFRTYRKSD